MQRLDKWGILLSCFILCMVDSRGIAGNVKLVAMNGNQYWFSSSSPYAPNLNFHLAYQYCRTLGLQLVVLETKEEVEVISAFLNSGDGATALSQNKYWTSGNKLGADSWIWMSSGEQLNSSFSDYWLKNGNGSPPENPKQCLSMRAPITKRAIFTADECNKSLPFICEQVRCLYYNYPVMMFPDPSDLRADIEEGTLATPTESESRNNPNYIASDKIRAQNFISGRNINNLSPSPSALALSDIAAQETERIDPSKIQRRITLRPVVSNYPYPPSYINSFYKYKTIDYAETSTNRPSFKKTTRESLWSPSPSYNEDDLSPTDPTLDINTSSSSIGSVTASIKKFDNRNKNFRNIQEKNLTYITGKVLKPSNSTVSTTIESSVRAEQTEPKTYTHLEIVTSKSTSIDGEEITEPVEEDEEGTTTLFLRYGSGSSETPTVATEYVSTSPSVVFDEEQNNVGGEVELEVETEKPVSIASRFFQGNGIRRPDTKSGMNSRGKSSTEDGTTTATTAAVVTSGDREASQTHSPATMKLYQFQRSKSPVNWSKTGGRSITIIANTNAGPGKIGLGPRLKFRNRNN